jgi:hypothetical protein
MNIFQRVKHYTIIIFSRSEKDHMNQKTNDNCNVHKNQMNSFINNLNIKCVNSERHEKHQISRNYVINIMIVNNIKHIKKSTTTFAK